MNALAPAKPKILAMLLGTLALCPWSPLLAQDHADDSYSAFNKAFLVKANGRTYYKINTVDSSIMRSWGQCLEIAVVEDVCERTHDSEQLNLLFDLLNNALLPENDGANWTRWDTWNDDIAWMGIAFIRGYEITGRHAYLDVAKDNWNRAYDRGWETTYGGGGIWEFMDNLKPGGKPSKNALSNDPMITIGCALYEATGDKNYLTKSKNIYAWVRARLFNPKTGQVNEGVSFPSYGASPSDGELLPSDNVYNSGSFVEAANCLYRWTGDKMYDDDALLAINHVVGAGPILHNDEETTDNQWAYRFIRGLSQFCTYNYWGELIPHSTTTTYYAWMLGNANAAWDQRDSQGLTWNNWTKPTNDTTPNPPNGVECSSAVSIWQELANVPQEDRIVRQ
jgi:predicted alpha-1,6-mannanase (GH76 family)